MIINQISLTKQRLAIKTLLFVGGALQYKVQYAV